MLRLKVHPTGTQAVYRLTFPTALGRTYHVEDSATLFSNDWKTLYSDLPGIGNDLNLIHTSTVERAYFRIGVTFP